MNHGNSIKEFADTLPESIKLTGTLEDKSALLLLKAGKLKMNYGNGSLRFISAGRTELLKMVYAAVRDREWNSVMPVIEDEKITNEGDTFKIELKCHYRTNGIDFLAIYTIIGGSDSCITLVMEGEALEKFQKNRIGWCILHPVEGCAGEKCLVEHINGSREQSVFPESISPYQVFTNIRALNWSHGAINCRLEFEGDNFETEDQRNWTDDSYKTYSTPLTLPYPATVEKGTRIFQKVTFRVDGVLSEQDPEPGKTVIRLFTDETFRLPEIGIGRKSGLDSSLTENEIKILRSLRFDHYRVDIHLRRPDWQKDADRAASESHDLGFPVELALFFDDNYSASLRSFVIWYQSAKITVSSILLFHVSLPLIPDERAGEIIRSLREIDPDLWIATGTNANFAQLNRNRPGDSRNDSICFSIHPQEHLSDNITIIENLRAQGYAVSSARRFGGNKKITVSPVNIQKRFNANKTLYETPWSGSGIPPQIDSRQMSLLGACWTAISIKYIGEAGADSVTYFETTGERGIIQGDRGSQWPEYFKSVSGMIFPVYHVFRFILGNKNLTGIKSVSSDPVAVDTLALSDGRQARIILVNFTDHVQRVGLECCSGLFRIRTLCTACFAEAAENMRWSGIENEKVIQSQENFEIEPYSINFIEGWKKR